jgi:periplasmic mercuric ion binding protein
MKTNYFIAVAVFAIMICINSNAQSNANSKIDALKTVTIKVGGNCESCKTRIEKVAKIDGVSKADWNKETKILTLIYNPSKVNSDNVQKKIASVGHDTEKYKADDKVYNSLPECCKYR